MLHCWFRVQACAVTVAMLRRPRVSRIPKGKTEQAGMTESTGAGMPEGQSAQWLATDRACAQSARVPEGQAVQLTA